MATGIAVAAARLHERLFANGQRPGRQRFGFFLDGEPEAIGQHGLQQEVRAVRGGVRWNLHDHVVAIHLQPAGAAQNFVGLEAVGDADEIEHGGVAQFVTATPRRIGAHVPVHAGGGGDVDVGQNGLRGVRRLAEYRGRRQSRDSGEGKRPHHMESF